jgi:hypothetical protein
MSCIAVDVHHAHLSTGVNIAVQALERTAIASDEIRQQ